MMLPPTTPHGFRRARRCASALLVAGAVGCDATPEAQVSSELPLLALGDAPELEIGVFEGDEAYELEMVVGTLRLPGGEIAVSDAQAARVSVFSREGEIVRSWGGTGDGPGEFRSLSGIRLWAGDSLLALDGRDGRVSVFDGDGAYGREMAAADLSGDSLFSLDVWMHRRFIVDGVMDAPDRERVRALLADLHPPRAGDGYRWVKAARDGRLWVREPGAAAAGAVRWTILDASGRAEALIDLPAALDPHDVGREEVLGRWVDDNDVNYVRAYRVLDTGETRPAPAWMAAGAPGPGTDVVTDSVTVADLKTMVTGAVRMTATMQELHYAEHFRYSPYADSLELEFEDPIAVRFLQADDRGWSGIFTHPRLDGMCGLGYGAATPPGWRPGTVICGT